MYLLDSRVFYSFLALNWYWIIDLKVEKGETFGVWLADRLEVSKVCKVCCFFDLGTMKIAPIFCLLNCNVPCVMGIPFLYMVNPTKNGVNYSVKISTVLEYSPLKVVQQGDTTKCDIVSAK